MSSLSFSDRVAAARGLLEEAVEQHDDLSTEQMVNVQEAIEFLRRLEASFRDEYADD